MNNETPQSGDTNLPPRPVAPVPQRPMTRKERRDHKRVMEKAGSDVELVITEDQKECSFCKEKTKFVAKSKSMQTRVPMCMPCHKKIREDLKARFMKGEM